MKDIRNWAGFPRWNSGLVRTIFIGGGTGSILRTENLKRVVDAVFDCFTVADDYEMTLEGNAADFNEEKIDYLVRSRINRVSLGVQSFHPEVLEIIGSPHAAEESIRAIRACKRRASRTSNSTCSTICLVILWRFGGVIWKHSAR